MIKKNYLFMIAVGFLFTGCSPVSMIRSWNSPGYKAKNYQQVLVACANDSAAALRNHLTRLFSASLSQAGYAAQPADTIITWEALEGNLQQQTFSMLRNSGTDALLSIAWTNKETEYYYIPTTLKYNNADHHQQAFMYPFPPIPDYSVNDHYAERTSDLWIIGLYDVALGKVVYTARIKTDRLAGTNGIAEKYVQLVMNDMIRKGIIRKACCPQLAKNSK